MLICPFSSSRDHTWYLTIIMMMNRLIMRMMVMKRLIMMMVMTRSIIRIEAAEFDICTLHPTIDPNNFSTSKIPLCSMFMRYELLLPGVLRWLSTKSRFWKIEAWIHFVQIKMETPCEREVWLASIGYLVQALLLTIYLRYTFWFCSSTTNRWMNK